MVITVICDVYSDNDINGTVITTNNLIRYLRKHHTVRIVCADQSKKGLKNYYVVPTVKLHGVLRKYVESTGVALPKVDKKVINAALKGADHVHVMLPFWLGYYASKQAHKMGISLTAGCHMLAENLTGYIWLKWLRLCNYLVYRSMIRHVYRYCGGIHYPTKLAQESLEKRTKRRIPAYIISNGISSYIHKVNVPKPEEYQDKFVILTVGRYAIEKSQDTLIRAVAYSKYKDQIQLILAGDGVKKQKYQKLAKRLKTPVLFKFFNRDAINDVINMADLYVHTAVDELEGISVLEAIACGKMVVVSDAKNNASKDFVINQKCIFKHHDAMDLARVIDYWVEHPEEKTKYENMYLNNHIVYDQEECMAKVEAMIQEVHDQHIAKK